MYGKMLVRLSSVAASAHIICFSSSYLAWQVVHRECRLTGKHWSLDLSEDNEARLQETDGNI